MVEENQNTSFLSFMEQKGPVTIEGVLTCLFAQYILGVLFACDLGVSKNLTLAKLLFEYIVDTYERIASLLGRTTEECLAAIPQSRNNVYILENAIQQSTMFSYLSEGAIVEMNSWCAYNLLKNSNLREKFGMCFCLALKKLVYCYRHVIKQTIFFWFKGKQGRRMIGVLYITS